MCLSQDMVFLFVNMVLPQLASVKTFKVLQHSGMTMFLLAVFEPYKDPRVDTLAPKLLFIALNLAGLVLGIWKVKL